MSYESCYSAARRVGALLLTLICALGMLPVAVHAEFAGGFIEQPHSAQVREQLTAEQIQGFLPARGAFTFPEPYNTEGVRITNATDCSGGDCVQPVGYSYWRNMNNHVGSDTLYLFLGLNRNNGGGGPTLFSYNKVSEEVNNLGALFDANSSFSYGSTEGWYFSGTQPTGLYVNDGPRMLRYDVLSKQFQTVYDVSATFGADKYIWQMHSSDDDKVHSATLRNSSTYQMLGCVVYREDIGEFRYFPAIGDFDECHIDKSGRWLVSLENIDGQYDADMRIFDVALAFNLLPATNLLTTVYDLVGNGIERQVLDQDSAIGHADMGHGYAVGADNWNAMPNSHLAWDFNNNPLSGSLVFHNDDWSVTAANHISHTNARPGVPMEQQYACGSNASIAASPWGNEVVCFKLDGSLNVLVAAPVMTNMNSSVGGDNYEKQPKGNLDVTGQYFIWTSNSGGSRVDAFIVKVPAQLLGEISSSSSDGSTQAQASPDVSISSSTSDNNAAANQSGGGSGGFAFLLPVLLSLTVRRKQP